MLILGACELVQFQKQKLYDRYDKPTAEQRAESVIFSDAQGSLWHSLFYCGDFKITNEAAYSGKSSIKISWDKSKGCEWIGFGNSFSNWTAVDMSEERMRKALTFYVRSQNKTSGALPIVASLEDFSGGGSYHYIDTKKYLYGLEIDTTWKLVVVPLWDFPIIEDEVDIRAIKQMKFQLEGGGSFYLDEIRLIDYTPAQFKKFRAEVEAMKPKGNPNQVVYNAAEFEFSTWNTGKSACQTVKLIEESGFKFISWEYNAESCNWAKWGINWNGWYQINFRGILDVAVLELKYKTQPNSQFHLFIEDFRGKSHLIFREYGKSIGSEEWKVIRLPLNKMDLLNNGFALDQIKQLLFEGKGKGKVQIEHIKIFELK
jgi:hypothetical protein